MWQLGLSLTVLLVASFATREKCVIGTALALLTNWSVNTMAARSTGDDFPWGLFLATDYLTGLAIVAGMMLICEKPKVGPIIVSSSYIIECIAHVAYSMSSHGAWAKYYYWQMMFWVAVCQALFVFGWGVYELARRHLGAHRGLSSKHGMPHRAEEGGA